MSFNLFRTIEGLEKLLGLKKVYLLSNKLTKIQNLDHLTMLTMLELGDNRIRVSLILKMLCNHLTTVILKINCANIVRTSICATELNANIRMAIIF